MRLARVRWSLLLLASLAGCPSSTSIDAGADTALLDAPALPDVPIAADTGLDALVEADAGTDAPIAVDGGADAPVRTDVGPLTGDRYAFVLSTADLPEVNGRDEAPGFDLDGLPGIGATDRCDDEIDYFSPVTGAPSIDNQFSANVAGLLAGMFVGGFRGEIERSFAAGDGLVGLVLEGVDSFAADPLIVVHAYQVTTVDGMPPALGADGRITAGQSFRITADLGFREGSIAGGRIDGGFDGLPLPGALPVSIGALRLGAAVSATGLSAGEIGGHVTVADVLALASSLGLGVSEGVIRMLARPDLFPDPSGLVCDAISVGMDFEAVAATIE